MSGQSMGIPQPWSVRVREIRSLDGRTFELEVHTKRFSAPSADARGYVGPGDRVRVVALDGERDRRATGHVDDVSAGVVRVSFVRPWDPEHFTWELHAAPERAPRAPRRRRQVVRTDDDDARTSRRKRHYDDEDED